MTTTIYGIANCDTIKKTLNWFKQQGLAHHFHDYRKQGIDADWLAAVESKLGWEAMLNRRGTTWRTLDEKLRANLDQQGALLLMQQHPALIKRPLIEHEGQWLIGFDADTLTELML
ncbi:ArsC family reductase [Pseudaeromonas sharmana]|uniref:ArsC family reductase n=1 Tax=Pseudaeromonas sharmana TaxID=328412 RepID=A0ABV8CKR2_9GAMM